MTAEHEDAPGGGSAAEAAARNPGSISNQTVLTNPASSHSLPRLPPLAGEG